MAGSLIKANVQSDGTINDEELHKAITLLKYEKESEHERNIQNMTQVYDYKSPWKDKDATTVNDSEYKFLNSWNDDESDSSKQVDTSKEPIKGTHVHDTSVGTTNVDTAVTGVVIIGQGRPRAISRGSITQGMIHGGTSIISSNFITHILTDPREMILKSDLFPFNTPKSKTIVIAPLTGPFLNSDRGVRTLSEIGDSRPEYGRIGTPFVNKHIWNGDDNFSVRSDVREADKLDTAVQ